MNRINYIFCIVLTLSSALSYGMHPLDIYQLDKKEANIPEILLGKKTYLSHNEGAVQLADAILSDPRRKAAWDALCQLGMAYENTDATQFAQAFTKVECYKNKWTTCEHETFDRTWWDTYTTIIYMLHNTFNTKEYAFAHILLGNTTPTASIKKPQLPTDSNLPTNYLLQLVA